MSRRLRQKILTKLAQESNTPVAAPPTTVPTDLFSNLGSGYNPGTIPLLIDLVEQLNAAIHYASRGKDSFQELVNNSFNLDISRTFAVDQKNINILSKKVFETFLNRKNSFSSKIPAAQIHDWCSGLTSSSEFSNLSQVNPASPLASKLPQDLKPSIQDLVLQIKAQNPITR